jgi:hypothetical protein
MTSTTQPSAHRRRHVRINALVITALVVSIPMSAASADKNATKSQRPSGHW